MTKPRIFRLFVDFMTVLSTVSIIKLYFGIGYGFNLQTLGVIIFISITAEFGKRVIKKYAAKRGMVVNRDIIETEKFKIAAPDLKFVCILCSIGLAYSSLLLGVFSILPIFTFSVIDNIPKSKKRSTMININAMFCMVVVASLVLFV